MIKSRLGEMRTCVCRWFIHVCPMRLGKQGPRAGKAGKAGRRRISTKVPKKGVPACSCRGL